MVYNTGVSSFIIGERILLRAESQLVVAHGTYISNEDKHCHYFLVLYFETLYLYFSFLKKNQKLAITGAVFMILLVNVIKII